MAEVAAPSMAGERLARLRERVVRTTQRLNAGDPEPLLDSYRLDLELRSPIGEAPDDATDFVLRGRDAYRRYLLAFLEFHHGFDVVDVALAGEQLTIRLLTRTGEPKRLVLDLDPDDRARCVTVYGGG